MTLGCSVGEARGRGAAVQNIFHDWYTWPLHCTQLRCKMTHIFAGSPSEEEIQQLEALGPAPDLLALLRRPGMTGIREKNFQALFPFAPPAAVKLLREMLRFSAEPPHAPSDSSSSPPPPQKYTAASGARPTAHHKQLLTDVLSPASMFDALQDPFFKQLQHAPPLVSNEQVQHHRSSHAAPQ